LTYNDIPRLLTMTIVWLLLLVWYLKAYCTNCIWTLAIVLAIAALVFVSGTELRLAKRRVFLVECLEARSVVFRWLQRRYVLLAVELVKSALLALLLMVSTLDFAPRHWSLLFADVLLLGLLVPRFYGLLAGQVRDEYRFVAARRGAIWVSTLLLWLESTLVLIFANGQTFVGLRWQEVVTYGAADIDVRCAPIAAVAAILSAVDALGLWSVQNLARNLQDLPQTLMASLGLAVSVGLSFVLAYAYSRALIGAIGRPWTMWRIAPRPSEVRATPAPP
jgi:hypothetical protein